MLTVDQAESLFRRWMVANNLDPEHITSFISSPKDWSVGEPYFEELQHIIPDYKDDLGVALPDELIAFKLSHWTGSDVPVDYPLVRDHDHWLQVYYLSEYGDATPDDERQLLQLVRNIARGELLENMGTEEEAEEHLTAPRIEAGQVYVMALDRGPIYLAVSEHGVAILDSDRTVMYDFDGHKLHADANMDRITNFIVQGAKISRPLTEPGELASLVGNHLADLIIGTDGISILDLP